MDWSLTALKLPHLSIWPLVQTVDVGRPVQFRCTSAGFPRPEIFWSREDGDDEEGTYSMSANGFLTISNVRVVDEGGYICTARNRGGEVSRKAVLYVRCKDNSIFFFFPNEYCYSHPAARCLGAKSSSII